MKFLFIMPPDAYDLDAWQYPSWRRCRIAPIGLMTLMSYLDTKGHEVRLLDCRATVFNYRMSDFVPIACALTDYNRPDVIGINMLTAMFDHSRELIRELKLAHPKIPIIAGGPHPSVEPLNTFERIPELDAVCIGAGEEVCLDVAEGKNWRDIPGLMLRDAPEVFQNRKPETDLDRYPFPNYDLIDHYYYTVQNVDTCIGFLTSSISAIVSRSCPFSCKFCSSDWSKPYRHNSSDYVIELAKYLARFDAQWICFYDDSIANDRRRLERICEGFIQSGLFYPRGKTRWKAAIRADQADPKLLRLMRDAGCGCLGIGSESGNDRILRIMNKRVTVEMNKRALRVISDSGIVPSTYFAIGFPSETEEEIMETLAFMDRIDVNRKGFSTFKPLPGSPFYYEFLERGLIDKETVNWSRLGNYGQPPDQTFCEVSLPRLRELFHLGYRKAMAHQYYAVFENHAHEMDRTLLREVDTYDPRRTIKILISRPERPEEIVTAAFREWIGIWRRIWDRTAGKAVRSLAEGSDELDSKERYHVADYCQRLQEAPIVTKPPECVLFDARGRKLMGALRLTAYSRRIWDRPFSMKKGAIFFFPTEIRDHLATDYFPVSTVRDGSPWVCVIAGFSHSSHISSSLLIHIQDRDYNQLGTMSFNTVVLPAKETSIREYVRIPKGIDQIRLCISSIDGMPVHIPYHISVEQSKN